MMDPLKQKLHQQTFFTLQTTLRSFRYHQIADELRALLKLEVLPAYHKRNATHLYNSSPSPSPSSAPSQSQSILKLRKWRQAFVQWCIKFMDMCVDEFNFHRETADVATSYLDQYLHVKMQRGSNGGDSLFDVYDDGKDGTAADGSEQSFLKTMIVVSTACIFLAIKVHESNPNSSRNGRNLYGNFDIQTLFQMHGGSPVQVTREDIVRAEMDVSSTLDYHLTPPTVMSFLRLYLAFLDHADTAAVTAMVHATNQNKGGEYENTLPTPPLTDGAIHHVKCLAKYLSELSLYDPELYFVNIHASIVALACLLTALEGISRDRFPQIYRQYLVNCIHQEVKLETKDWDGVLYDCRMRLRKLFETTRHLHWNHNSHPRSSSDSGSDNIPNHENDADDDGDGDDEPRFSAFHQKLHRPSAQEVSVQDYQQNEHEHHHPMQQQMHHIMMPMYSPVASHPSLQQMVEQQQPSNDNDDDSDHTGNSVVADEPTEMERGMNLQWK